MGQVRCLSNNSKPGTNSRGLPSQDRDKEAEQRISDVYTSEVFKKACEDAGIEKSRRQASKFYHKCGLAYKTHTETK